MTIEELKNKKVELETQYNELVKLGEQKEEQYKADKQSIRDNLNYIRGVYQAYTDMIEIMVSEEQNNAEDVIVDKDVEGNNE